MIDGAKNTLAVALACACAGIIIGMVALTGAGIVFTQLVLGLAQNSLLLALVLTAMAGIVLGMGMPTTPAYIVMTALLVPAIIKLGVDRRRPRTCSPSISRSCRRSRRRWRLPSTPPRACAKSDLWATGWAAMRIGAAGFIVPFMFVYEPALLMIGDWPTIIWRFVASSFGDPAPRRRPARLLLAPRLALGARRPHRGGVLPREAGLGDRSRRRRALRGRGRGAMERARQAPVARRCKARRRRADRVSQAAEDPSRAGTPPLLRG